MRALPFALLLLSLVACRGENVGAPPADAPPPLEQDQPAEDVPPATAPRATSTGAMPAPGAIGFAGFGSAPFGANEEQVRMAWGAGLGGAKPAEPGGCYSLMTQSRPESGYRLAFMFEGGKFARIDVDAADIDAPGGGRVGMSADEIRRLYSERVEEQPHKYIVGGHYLRIRDPEGGNGVLLFETDADGRVDDWRIGIAPQIDYVEGCS